MAREILIEIACKLTTIFFVRAVRAVVAGVTASAIVQTSSIPALELVLGADCHVNN